MSKEQKYFRRQKLVGALMIALAVLTIFILGGDLSAFILLSPIGFYMYFTKEKIFTDAYFFETYEDEEDEEI